MCATEQTVPATPGSSWRFQAAQYRTRRKPYRSPQTTVALCCCHRTDCVPGHVDDSISCRPSYTAGLGLLEKAWFAQVSCSANGGSGAKVCSLLSRPATSITCVQYLFLTLKHARRSQNWPSGNCASSMEPQQHTRQCFTADSFLRIPNIEQSISPHAQEIGTAQIKAPHIS